MAGAEQKKAEVSARVQLFKKFVTERGYVDGGCRNFSAKKSGKHGGRFLLII
jgi:hypothetical protein